MISRLSTKTLKFIPMGLERGLLFKTEVEKKIIIGSLPVTNYNISARVV